MDHMKYLPVEATREMIAASGVDPETAAKIYAQMTAAFNPVGITVRKAFICDQCEFVYCDDPVTTCDCAVRATTYVEGEISYLSPKQ